MTGEHSNTKETPTTDRRSLRTQTTPQLNTP
jgi:hypothetical protein